MSAWRAALAVGALALSLGVPAATRAEATTGAAVGGAAVGGAAIGGAPVGEPAAGEAAQARAFGGGAAPAAHEAPRLDFVSGQVGAPAGKVLTGPALDEETHRVALLLRCPVCQGSSVGDSPSESARNMKAEVRDLLAMGFSEEQILRYFELSYGEFVRMSPKAEGLNLLVWIVPGVLLLVGGGAVGLALRRLRTSQSEAGAALQKVPGRDEVPDDPELAAWVLRVRERAYGWPGGRAPGTDGR